MKKFISALLGLVCLVAIMLAGAENPDGSCNVLWTLSCLGVAGLCGYGWDLLEKHNEKTTK